MKRILILIIFLLCSSKVLSKEVWIYSDDGAWIDGIIALEQFFDYNSITHKRVYAKDLNTSNSYSEADAICFPGGYAYDYKLALSPKTIVNIREYVSKGGSYIGICAGAFFASSNVVWEGEEYPYSLSLFKGKATGSIQKIAAWDNYAMTKISINQENKIFQKIENDLTVLYFGGPYFESEETIFDTIATWDGYNNFPAIINFNYEKGRVLLIGPHLEIEENNDRDSTMFAFELNDIESDWDFLATIANWVLDIETGVDESIQTNQNLITYPNPASDYIEISISDNQNQSILIFNSLGIEIKRIEANELIGKSSICISIDKFPVGIYYCTLTSTENSITKSFVVLR